MPAIEEGLDNIYPFTRSHGLDLHPVSGGQYEGECPVCSKPFRVSVETGQWTCKGCQVDGNIPTFLRWLYSVSSTDVTEQKDFAKSRSLLNHHTLDTWGFRQSRVTREWIVPGYDLRGEVMNLYIYRKHPTKNKKMLWSTFGCDHQLLGYQEFDKRKSHAVICESLWDAMVLSEVLRNSKTTSKGIKYTDDKEKNDLARTNIVAVPGCRVFKETWTPLFSGKKVTLIYHSDHPKRNPVTGSVSLPEGYEGMRRVVDMLTTSDDRPENISYLSWGDEGYDSELKDGFDIRDWLGLPDDQLPKNMTEGEE